MSKFPEKLISRRGLLKGAGFVAVVALAEKVLPSTVSAAPEGLQIQDSIFTESSAVLPITEIVSNPESFEGQKVTISGFVRFAGGSGGRPGDASMWRETVGYRVYPNTQDLNRAVISEDRTIDHVIIRETHLRDLMHSPQEDVS